MLSTEPILKFYDPKKDIKISSYSSMVQYSCKSTTMNGRQWLTKAEQNYALIDKEGLWIVFACERFHQYIYRQELECETDHKPLVSNINKKNWSDCPLRIQRLLPRRTAGENSCWTFGHREMSWKGPWSLILDWNESVYFMEGQKLFNLPKISTKAGTTTILMPHPVVNYPWEKIGVDLCVFEKGKLFDSLWLLQQFSRSV